MNTHTDKPTNNDKKNHPNSWAPASAEGPGGEKAWRLVTGSCDKEVRLLLCMCFCMSVVDPTL